MSKFSDDLVGGAVLLILTHQFFDFCKCVVDKLATTPQPSNPTATGFTNPLMASLVNRTPQPAVRLPFPWSSPFPPTIPLPHWVRRSQPRFRRTSLLPDEAKAEVVVHEQETKEIVFRDQETKTMLLTETRVRVDRRHTELTEKIERWIKDRPYLLIGLYGPPEARKKASREIARVVCGTADNEKLPRNLTQYLGR